MTLKLLALGAAAEAATGFVLAASPVAFIRLLMGAELSGPGIALGRLTGFALLALGVACWPGRGMVGGGPALLAMLVYSLLAAAYLLSLGLGGAPVGLLLWPAVLAHGVLTLLLGRAWLERAS
jgi:hypothetical protein